MVVEFDRFVGSVSFVWAKYVGRGRWAQSEELTAAAIRLAGDFRGSFLHGLGRRSFPCKGPSGEIRFQLVPLRNKVYYFIVCLVLVVGGIGTG